MDYYFSKQLSMSFDEAVARVVAEHKREGFGVLTEIDVKIPRCRFPEGLHSRGLQSCLRLSGTAK